jgi:hypothetical protein
MDIPSDIRHWRQITFESLQAKAGDINEIYTRHFRHFTGYSERVASLRTQVIATWRPSCAQIFRFIFGSCPCLYDYSAATQGLGAMMKRDSRGSPRIELNLGYLKTHMVWISVYGQTFSTQIPQTIRAHRADGLAMEVSREAI